MCENFRKLIVRKNCKIGAVECDKLDKLFIKHSHTPGGWEKNSHTCVKFQDILSYSLYFEGYSVLLMPRLIDMY